VVFIPEGRREKRGGLFLRAMDCFAPSDLGPAVVAARARRFRVA